MPTLALRERRESIGRALRSVLDQSAVKVRLLVVVNGPRRDPEVLRDLAVDRRVEVVTLEAPSLPGAMLAGRSLVDTEWFATLDDDDYLLPSALALRVNALTADPEIDTVVTNGFRHTAAGDTLHLPDASAVQRDPLGTLLRSNWLLPGSWLSRTKAVGPELFAGMPPYLECTYLAVRFAMTGRMLLLATPTVVWSADTPGSASKSEEYMVGEVEGLRTILELPLSGGIRRGFQRKVSDACHALSHHYLGSGQPGRAWEWHVQSLVQRGGLRYLAFSRHLLASAFTR